MNIKQIKPTTFALFVAALLVLIIAAYTANKGFQLAGGLIFFVAVVLAIYQARSKSGDK